METLIEETGGRKMRTAIIYYSRHHGNTKKLIDAIARTGEIELVDVTETKTKDLNSFDLIGFASGIYYRKMHKALASFAENNLPAGKKVFFLYTYGAAGKGYTASLSKVCREKGAEIAGEYGCLGFDTFGPFKLIGGVAKGHPNESEIEAAVSFFQALQKVQ